MCWSLVHNCWLASLQCHSKHSSVPGRFSFLPPKWTKTYQRHKFYQWLGQPTVELISKFGSRRPSAINPCPQVAHIELPTTSTGATPQKNCQDLAIGHTNLTLDVGANMQFIDFLVQINSARRFRSLSHWSAKSEKYLRRNCRILFPVLAQACLYRKLHQCTAMKNTNKRKPLYVNQTGRFQQRLFAHILGQHTVM